mmetsp:Transcript_33677/g.36275  ORF Transcript_33677/g.36275 Transcript_33677/m.36275 type:complete len:537 (-) Transcript_33677:1233-2843(-)
MEGDATSHRNRVSSSRDNTDDDNLAVHGINGLFCNNNRRELVRTPMTEASSPESGKCTNVNDDLSPSSEDQLHFSQTDHHIRFLDQNGSLNEVAGSESMFSQEFVEQKSSYTRGIELSQETQPESSILMAKRLGLLAQTQEEEDQVIANKYLTERGIHQQLSSDRHDFSLKSSEMVDTQVQASKQAMDKAQLFGLELLTQVGSNEADKLPSFHTSNSFIGREEIDEQSNTFIPSITAVTTNADPTDTSIRESNGFGFLLNAVAKITEQEELVKGRVMPMIWQPSSQNNNPLHEFRYIQRRSASPSETALMESSTKHYSTGKRTSKPKIATSSSYRSTFKKRKTEAQKDKEMLRKEKLESENIKAQAIAKKAAMIAERTISDPAIAKKILLSMALKRENPRSAPQVLPGEGHVIQEGFFWAHYPPLEFVLKKNMAEYYELSTKRCQSTQQQAFNNYMVLIVRGVAENEKWKFANCFEEDKCLRDRIRCYYKTHIQNSKKRLRTMLNHPTKRANARHLCEHLDLIEQYSVQEVEPNNK